ncbi:MAG: hypothetical protein KAR62_03490 [Sphingomonadales bacterium]|nr:hypothetical protein [Sphingomonadales bacterium]
MSNLKNAILASTAIFTLIAQPVLAEDGEFKFWPTPEYKAADGSFSLKARGRLMQDFGWVSDRDGTLDISESETRTGRLGFELKTDNNLKLKVEVDFVPDGVDFTDATLSWKGPVTITVGNFKIPTSLEESTSGRHITFIDRGSFTDAFSIARSLGVSVGKSGSNWSFVAGVGKGSINESLDNTPVTYATRATYSPQVEGMDVHLGASVRYRKTTGTGSDFRYRQRPHNHMAPRFINTGSIADSDTMFGAEFAVVKGPFSVQAEYSTLSASLSAPEVGQNDPSFSGGYVSASYFLTGESRNYSASKGSFGNVKPNNPVSKGGLGAWQLAARFDTIDLSDEGIFGGKQDTYIFGVNWHLTRHVRLMFNASTSNITDATLVAENGADGANKVDAYGVRMQVNW